MTYIRGLITPLMATHEPPSKVPILFSFVCFEGGVVLIIIPPHPQDPSLIPYYLGFRVQGSGFGFVGV